MTMECKECGNEVEIPNDLILGQLGNTLACPKCEETIKFSDILKEEDISKEELRNYREELKSINQSEGEESEEPTQTEMATPNDCLERTLEIDPKLGGKNKDKKWIMDRARETGPLTSDAVEKLIKQLDISKANNAAARVVDTYINKIRKEIESDPSLVREDIWKNYLRREPRINEPENLEEIGTDIGEIDIDLSGLTETGAGSSGSVDLDLGNKSDKDVKKSLKKMKIAKERGDKDLMREAISEMSGTSGGEDVFSSIDDYISKMVDYRAKMKMLEMLESGGMFGESNNSEPKRSGEVEELKQEIKKLKEDKHQKELKKRDEKIKELKSRVETQQQQSQQQGQGGLENEIIEQVRNQAVNRLVRGSEDKSISMDQIKKVVSDEMDKVPTGEMNEYQADVKKTKYQAEAEEKKAEHQKEAVTQISQAIMQGLNQMGYNIGRGAATTSLEQEERRAKKKNLNLNP